MSVTAAEFSFAFRDEQPVLSAGRQLARLLAEGAAISRRSLNDALDLAFGGTDADARWSTGDGHAALELAQVIWLRDHCGLTAASRGAEASSVLWARTSLSTTRESAVFTVQVRDAVTCAGTPPAGG